MYRVDCRNRKENAYVETGKTRGMFGKHMLRGFKWPPGRLHFKEFSTFKLGFYDDVPLRSTLG